ncbi:Zn(II)2Cys6 transcription factor [Aspergillus aculeatinus CBS 121060]|uniref:C6 transcription factor n=1 Tax=Aspergillus aculeatinus CBS 121060 TaxID=1448322 RepID=A0ACD1HNB4_9EURO|nr:C6 transcription factor [Aspergillus aculeatinus CBS 121060]RAH74941.1 C6 transcription factor [Aspergillus aculeatinus CBS 121060]
MRSDDSHEHIRKARKVTRACDACKAKKKACTGNIPCGPCTRKHLECTYQTAYNRGVALSPPPSASNDDRPFPTPGRGRGYSGGNAFSPYPRNRQTPTESLVEVGGDETSPEVAGQYWGPTSAHSFLDRVVQDLHPATRRSPSQQHDHDTHSKISIFSYGDRVVPLPSVIRFTWPDRATAVGLVQRYFDFAAPTYRVLHQPTVERLVYRMYESQTPHDRSGSSPVEPPLEAASQALLLLLFSTAMMFRVDMSGRMRDADDHGWQKSEMYYAQADHLLSRETGAPSMASVQARFLMVLYLLSSSRPHKAWFTFGTTVQLMMALGLHNGRTRRGHDGHNLVQKECQRRLVWCSYTLDKYLSVMLGRPRFWQDEDIDEDLPTRVNDSDLTPQENRLTKRDCLMDAPVFHVLLARILTRAVKEPYVQTGISSQEQIATICTLHEQVLAWQAGLPPFLSGVIHPSSLVPVFRRQLTVLRLARYHAVMFITRPLLLRNYGQMWPECEATYQQLLCTCLTAACDAIELILGFVNDDELYTAFWYSQYIAFNALSIIYIYLIQLGQGRIFRVRPPFLPRPAGSLDAELDEATLYKLSTLAQDHLANATARNAPSWKYSVILQGLRQELTRLGLPNTDASHPSDATEISGSAVAGMVLAQPHSTTGHTGQMPRGEASASRTGNEKHNNNSNATSHPAFDHDHYMDSIGLDFRTESLLDYFALDKDLMLDFWPQLDSLPINSAF